MKFDRGITISDQVEFFTVHRPGTLSVEISSLSAVIIKFNVLTRWVENPLDDFRERLLVTVAVDQGLK